MKCFKDLKARLGYVCKTKRGYLDELLKHISEKDLEEFESVGFIHVGYTLKNKTWSRTKFARRYFIDCFGYIAYLKLMLFKK